MQLYIDHLVGQRYYRLSAIKHPGSYLQGAFQGCIFGDDVCVEIEFCLY